jgi:anti-sigma regulatory factor (Ser/Thr protein kinase)
LCVRYHSVTGIGYSSEYFCMAVLFTKTVEVRDNVSEVGRIQCEFSALWQQLGLPADIENDVSLALEEVLSNVLRHSSSNGRPREIRVTFNCGPAGFAFEVSDSADPYDPLARPDPDLTLPLEQRRGGGLGVFLVKQLADELSYERRDGRNQLRFFKRFLNARSGPQSH